MSSEFYIRVPDASKIDEGHGRYKEELDEIISDTINAIDMLTALNSFSGKGADSIKAYFNEVHVPLLTLLYQLVALLDSIYNKPYYRSVLQAAENDEAGEFPSWDLWDKARAFENYKTNNVPPIDDLIRQAHNAAPAGYSFTTPSTSSLKNSLSTQSHKLDKVRTRFENAESSGVAALTEASSEYHKLYKALNDAISRCAKGKVKMTAYKSGDFHAATKDLGLKALSEAVQNELDANAEEVLIAKQMGAENHLLDIERERKKAEEEKQAYALGGEILQGVILGAAIAGLCVATGGVAIAFAAAGVASAAYGLGQRESQRYRMKKDAGVDIDKKDLTARTLKGVKDFKDYGKGADKVARNVGIYHEATERGYKKAANGAYRNSINAAANIGVAFATDMVEEQLDKQIGDDLTGKDKLIYDETMKVSKKAVEKGSEKAIDAALRPMKLTQTYSGKSILDRTTDITSSTQKTIGKAAGVVGFAAGCGQIYTDYKVEQADQALDKCNEQSENTKSYKASLTSGSARQWAVQW